LFGGFMKATIICIALMLGGAATAAENKPAENGPGPDHAPNHRLALLSRVTCPAVREAVKLYGEAAAEQWARGHGISETRIEQARRCLK
jgi:hypothetical protein